MTKVKVVKNDKRLLTEGQVREYLTKEGTVGWIRAGELLNSAHDACVDGRATNQIIGNPGGDIVRLLEAMVAIHNVTGFVFKPLEVEKIFRWYLHNYGVFYMHTDDHAMTALAKALSEDERIGQKLEDAKAMHNFLTKMPDSFKQRLRLSNYMTDPDFIGCGHLKLLASYPEKYGVSIKILRSLIISFFDTLWSGTKEEKKQLLYPMLKGKHKEQALVVVRVSEEKITKETWLPMIRPTDGEVSVFVEIPQARDFMAYTIAEQIGERYLRDRIGQVDHSELYRKISELQSEGVRETVSFLATGLPMYVVEITR